MVFSWDRHRLQEPLIMGIKVNGGCVESFNDSGICENCVKNGDFPRECEICMENRSFPKEFKYIVTIYPKYPDDETKYKYICQNCCENNAKEVMEVLAESDKTEII
jgi:hypothetical protein